MQSASTATSGSRTSNSTQKLVTLNFDQTPVSQEQIMKESQEEIYKQYMRTEMSCVDKIFDRYLSRFVSKLKLVILAIALAWIGFSTWRAVIIKSVSYNEQFLSSNQPVQRILDLKMNEFYNDQGIYMNFYLGLNQ